MKLVCSKYLFAILFFNLLLSPFSCAILKKEKNGYSGDEYLLKKTRRDIERFRKGELILKFVDRNGNPKRDIEIKYNQVSHQFLFGIFDDYDQYRFNKLKEAGINYATLHLNHGLTEPESKNYRFDIVDSIWRPDLLRDMGFDLHGHALIYMTKEMIPKYLYSMDFSQYVEFTHSHIRELIKRYSDRVKFWDIINEPTSKWANENKYSIRQILELIRYGVKEIREIFPSAKIIINHHNPAGEGHYYSPLLFTGDLEKEKIDYDIIGLQLYYNGYSKMVNYRLPSKSLYEISKIIDEYSRFRKEIHITEISVPSEKSPIERFVGYNGVDWSEDLQSIYLDRAYRIFFSKRRVKSITWWGGIDTGSFIYKGGLFTEENKPKKSFYALRHLTQEWTTNGAGKSDRKGTFRLRGFGGDYLLAIMDESTKKTSTRKITLKEQNSRVETVVLE